MQLASLYHHAELYDAVRPVDEDLASLIEDELARVSSPSGGCLFDPACGPGGWLARFAAGGWAVAGNDLSDEMLRATAAQLNGSCLELTRFDFRALAFAHGPYDAAVEPSGVLGELDDEGFHDHLRSTFAQLRPGGTYILVVPADDDPSQVVPDVLYEHTAQTADGRTVAATYRLLERVAADHWRVRREIRIHERRVVHDVIDEYVLHMRSIAAVLDSARRAGFIPLSVRCADTGAHLEPGQLFVGECVFVLHVPDTQADVRLERRAQSLDLRTTVGTPTLER